MADLSPQPGDIVWADLGRSVGREQAGRRPCVVISSESHLAEVDSLITVVPCTSRDRGWVNHVRIDAGAGLPLPTFAMTEQQRTISRQRVSRLVAATDRRDLAQVMRWVATWIHRP